MKLLILDADGVFLDERPYWVAALASALGRSGIELPAGAAWESLARAAFDEDALQRVTKDEGCNSNWDLSAVLDRSLRSPTVREGVLEALGHGRSAVAVGCLKSAAARLRSDHLAADLVNDPLSRFGIDRDSPGYRAVAADCDRILRGGTAGQPVPSPLKESLADTTRALDECTRAGFTLRVCTGRRRPEIEAAIAVSGLANRLPVDGITSATEVEQAEIRSGRPRLGKPHWFSPVAAAIGLEEALACLAAAGPPPEVSAAIFYAGDSRADFEAVLGARRAGVPIQYIQVTSPAVSPADLSEIARNPATRGVIGSLSGLAPILTRTGA